MQAKGTVCHRASARPVRTSVSIPSCVACKCLLGPEVKILGTSICEDNGEGGGKPELFCPEDFVYIRGLRDARWSVAIQIGRVLPVKCSACGVTSVAFGHKACGQCGSRAIVILPPKSAIVAMARG